MPYALALAFAGLHAAVVADASACQRLSFEDRDEEISRSMPNVDFPDRYFAGTGSSITDSFDCPQGQMVFLVEMTLPGLTYVRDIVSDGRVYPAYQVSERSPLLIFSHALPLQSGLGSGVALHNGQVNRHVAAVLPASRTIDHFVQMRVFFRGGAMERVPRTHLGTIEVWSENDPGNRFRHSFTLELNIPLLTCTLANASHTLDDVLANELAASGSNAKESSFDVAMNCPMDNIDVQLSLADANDPGSSNGQLAPAPGTTAGGVQVQLLRGGQPVQFGQAWSHGWSSKGQQAIPFSARYLRTADPLVPGDVKGEAVLTADYR